MGMCALAAPSFEMQIRTRADVALCGMPCQPHLLAFINPNQPEKKKPGRSHDTFEKRPDAPLNYVSSGAGSTREAQLKEGMLILFDLIFMLEPSEASDSASAKAKRRSEKDKFRQDLIRLQNVSLTYLVAMGLQKTWQYLSPQTAPVPVA